MAAFGRLLIPDERDRAYPLAAVLPRSSQRTYRYWHAEGWHGDQGDRPWCVVYAWGHWAEDGPVTQPATPHGSGPLFDLGHAYDWCQRHDAWPDEAYDGTSVRAGAKYLRDEVGIVSEFRWGTSVGEVALALLERGPVVVGTWWYDSMFEPDDDGRLRIAPRARRVGGHAYVLNGVNAVERKVRVKNSWGGAGEGFLGFDDLQRLLDEHGEACLALERRQEAP